MQSFAWRAAALALVLAGCAGAGLSQSVAEPAVADEKAKEEAMRRAFFEGGYIGREAMPDSLVINPPPPAEGSSAEARDQEASEAGLALQGTPRFELAAVDAAIFNPDGSSVFSCAANIRISKEDTPATDALLKKALPDLALSTYRTKTHYQRPRPFMVNGKPTCTPDHEETLRKDGSYPSGHSAIGYGWGLILAEVVPDRAAKLVARGREFGESRRICNVHWQSDVEEGRQVAAAVAARMHADAQFRADVVAARAEIASIGSKAPAPDCALEAAALPVKAQ